MKFFISYIALILLIFCNINATTITWNGGTSPDWNNSLNWNPNIVPSLNDSIVLTGTPTYNCSLTVANALVRSMTVKADYTMAFKQNKNVFSVDTSFRWEAGAAYASSDSTHFMMDTIFNMAKFDSIATNNKSIYMKSARLVKQFPGKFYYGMWLRVNTYTSSVGTDSMYANGSFGLIGTYSDVFPAVTMRGDIFIRSVGTANWLGTDGGTNGGYPWSVTSNWKVISDTTNATIQCYSKTPVQGVTYNIPRINLEFPSTITTTIHALTNTNANKDNVYNANDSIITPTRQIAAYTSSTTDSVTLSTWNFNTYISCQSLMLGSGTSGTTKQSSRFSFGNSVVNLRNFTSSALSATAGLFFIGSSKNNDSLYFNNSTWLDSGGVWAYNGAAKLFTDAGTSRFTTYGAMPTRALYAPNKRFYTFVDSGSVGTKDSLVSNMRMMNGRYIKGGKFGLYTFTDTVENFWRQETTVSDSFIARGANAAIRFMGSDPEFVLRGTGVQAIDSLNLYPATSLKIELGNNVTVKKLLPTRVSGAQKYCFVTQKTLTARSNTNYTMSGQGGILDTIVGDTLGRYALAAATVDSQVYVKNMAFQSFAYTCTTGCVDGGGDSNVIFKNIDNYNYLTPTIITLTNCTPSIVEVGTTPSITLTGTGFYQPCSLSVDGINWIAPSSYQDTTVLNFTFPTYNGRRQVNLRIKNTSSMILSRSDLISYNCNLVLPTISYPSVICTLGNNISVDPIITGIVDSIAIINGSLPPSLTINKTAPNIGRLSGVLDQLTTGNYTACAYACDTVLATFSLSSKKYPLFTTLKHPMGRKNFIDTIIGSGFYTNGGNARIGSTYITLDKQTDDTLIWTTPNLPRDLYKFIFTNKDSLRDTVLFRILVPAKGTTSP